MNRERIAALIVVGALGACEGPAGDVGPPGPPGTSPATVARTSTEPAGEECAAEGVKLELGPDADGDGALDDDEVDDAQTQYICGGAAGGSVVIVSLAEGHATCAFGGTSFTVGALTTYACNGEPAAAGDRPVAEDAVGQVAGFTTSSFTGDLGGRTGAHALCAADHAGSHLCHVAEYMLAGSAVAVPAAGAWLDPSSDVANTVETGREANAALGCASWTDATNGSNGMFLDVAGLPTSGGCASSRPLACCTTPARTELAGFTTATTTGNAGGRASMHALCAAAFAGSHMCHSAEYVRASSAAAVPGTGAWVDPSTVTGAADRTGRPTAGRQLTGDTCATWSSGSAGSFGGLITTAGASLFAACNTSHPVACCR